MPIEVADRIEQGNREGRLENSTFYYSVNGSDIDFSVDGILESNVDSYDQATDKKYIIRNSASIPMPTPGISVNNNDILAYDGSSWVLHKRVANAETSFGIVYDRRTKLVYQYDTDNGWLPLLRKNGTIDGGTF